MLFFYKLFTFFFYPFLIIFIYLRRKFNKEDPVRYREKIFFNFFHPNRNLQKKLIWFHAASLGEVQSIFPLIDNLNSTHKNLEFLITTVTLSSGNLVDKKYKNEKNITHRYFPLDVKFLIKKFLDVWEPNLIIFVDSEIWPNLIFQIKERRIPSILVNGRITKKSFQKWKFVFKFAQKIFSTFELCLSSSKQSMNYLNILKARNVKFIGNLKLAGKINLEQISNVNTNFFKNRKIWCAVSTHKGEENLCLETHKILKKNYNNLTTIIIPRHINRSNKIKLICDNLNLSSQIIKGQELINDNIEIVIINSFGELPSYLKYCNSVFVGKSILQKLKGESGQNPIEAAKLGCKVYHGPYVTNFKEIYELLNSLKISEVIKNEYDLSKKLSLDFENLDSKNDIINQKIGDIGDKILSNSIKEIKKFLI